MTMPLSPPIAAEASFRRGALRVRPVLGYPSAVTPERQYILTLDLLPESGDGAEAGSSSWPDPHQEEIALRCDIQAYPLFSAVEPLGESTLLLHRFGGTYGPVSFLLTPSSLPEGAGGDFPQEGRIRIKLLNTRGLPVLVLETEPIRLFAEDGMPPAPRIGIGRKPGLADSFPITNGNTLGEVVPPLPPFVTKQYDASPYSTWLYRFAWSPDGNWLVAPTHDGRLLVYATRDLTGPTPANPRPSPTICQNGINQVIISPDSLNLVAAGGPARTAWVWGVRLPSLQGRVEMPSNHSDVKTVAVTRGRTMVTGAQDGYIREWAHSQGSHLTQHGEGVRRTLVFRGAELGSERRYTESVTPAQVSNVIYSGASPVNHIASRPLPVGATEDVEWIAFCCDDGSVGFIRGGAENATPFLRFEHSGRVWGLAWTRDGSLLATGGDNGEILLWDFSDQWKNDPPIKPRFRVGNEHGGATVVSLSFDPSGRILASKAINGSIRFWRAANLAPLGGFDEQNQENHLFASLAFHPTLPLLASTGPFAGPLRVYEIDPDRLLQTSGSELPTDPDADLQTEPVTLPVAPPTDAVDELREALRALAVEYDTARAELLSGPERTGRMLAIVERMRTQIGELRALETVEEEEEEEETEEEEVYLDNDEDDDEEWEE